ncbi:MAG: hypothetical protein ACR2QG_02975 [Gammaproteobacteria bacterium]
MHNLRLVSFLAALFVSFSVWAAGGEVTFDEYLETSDIYAPNNYPTRVTTQGFEFYSPYGFLLDGTDSDQELYMCPGCATDISVEGQASTFALAWFEAFLVPGFPVSGNETITLTGCSASECVQAELPVSTGLNTYFTQFTPEDPQYPGDPQFASPAWANLQTLNIAGNGGPIGLDRLHLPTPDRLLALDVLPNDPDNVLYPNKGGEFSVFVYGDAFFDTLQVDHSTVRLGPVEASPTSHTIGGHILPDVIVPNGYTFKMQDTGILCNDTHVTLTGETFSGRRFQATDRIDATECEDGGCHAY